MDWREELKKNITTIEQLKKFCFLTTGEENMLRQVLKSHPLNVTEYYAGLINWNEENDPLRKIVIPLIDELNPDGSYDTSGERENTKLIGLQHKYGETALILSTHKCAAYCRYCFRKRMVGLPNNDIIRQFTDSIEYIKKHKEIRNILISGGDPFMLNTEIIEEMLEQLAEIEHLNFIRIGTKIPATFPHRIIYDDRLIRVLRNFSQKNKKIYIITHFDHPREFTELSDTAVRRLLDAGLTLNNQAVLLKDVNDDVETLVDLMNGLRKMGIVPYYLFQCRPVKSVKNHFQVPLKKAVELVRKVKQRLDGPSKSFRYVMSHHTGKIEILGTMGDEILLQYHQARNPELIGKPFTKKLNEKAAWLDDLEYFFSKDMQFDSVMGDYEN